MKFIYLLLIILISSCSKNEKGQQDEIHNSSTNINELIEMGKIKIGNASKEVVFESIKCNGVIEIHPNLERSIHLKQNSFIEEIFIIDGEKVKKGQKLFSFTSPDLIEDQKQLLELRAQLISDESDHKRSIDLFQNKSISEKEYNKIKSKYLSVKSAYEGMKIKLNFSGVDTTSLLKDMKYQDVINVSAPISGIVTGVDINSGKMVEPSSELLSLVGLDHLHLMLYIPGTYSGRVDIDDEVEFHQIGDKTLFKTKIAGISPVVDQRTGFFEAHCEIPKEIEINPGETINSEIKLNSLEDYILNNDAYKREGNDIYVFKQNGGEFVKTLIVDPIFINDKLLINDSINKFIVKGVYYLEN